MIYLSIHVFIVLFSFISMTVLCFAFWRPCFLNFELSLFCSQKVIMAENRNINILIIDFLNTQ